MRIALASALALCLAAPTLASDQDTFYALIQEDGARRAAAEPAPEARTQAASVEATGSIGTPGPAAGADAPAGVAAMVTRIAVAHGVDPALAHAVARVESRYRCSAVGRSGELGVMQVKPATARSVGVTGNLRDCATGIEAGIRYLKQAIAIHGEGCAAISAYNRGLHAPGRCTGYGRKVMALMSSTQLASLR